MTAALVLIGGTALIVVVSRRSLLLPRSHGFPRAFAFEAILALAVLNVPVWFVRPLAAHQIVSWALLCGSAALALHGYLLLRRLNRAVPSPPGSPTYGWENSTRLVTDGAYRWIRHPMYASLLYLAWGVALKTASVPSVLLAVLASACLYLAARAEEVENVARFGAAYRDYMARTRRFVPRVF